MARGGKREGAGRKPGVQNQLSREAKDVIAQVAESLGGADGLLKWVKADPANAKVFWGGMYVKLLPMQLTGANGGPMEHSLSVHFGKR
jgi:hypothetical protein